MGCKNKTELIKIKVRVEFKKDISSSDLPSSGDTSVVFKFIGDYKQADENAVPKPVWILPEGKTKDTLTTGDTIRIRNEEFKLLILILERSGELISNS